MDEACVNNEAPNWSELDIELSCPRCAYNLKMLTLPRCPECGLHFQWDELIRAVKEFNARPPIFEYHWRYHPIRSFLFTCWMCLQPWRLWRWLPLSAVPVARALLFLLVFVIASLILISLSKAIVWQEFSNLRYGKAVTAASAAFHGPMLRRCIYGTLHELAVPSLLMFTIWLTIQIFRQTIARYRVRQKHILRIFVFCWIGVVGWQFLCDFVLLMIVMPMIWFFNNYLPNSLIWGVEQCPLIILFLSLGFGFHSYLRVRSGWLWALLLLVFTSMLIIVVGLLISTVLLDTFDNAYWRYLTEWSQSFSLLQDLATQVFISLHGL